MRKHFVKVPQFLKFSSSIKWKEVTCILVLFCHKQLLNYGFHFVKEFQLSLSSPLFLILYVCVYTWRYLKTYASNVKLTILFLGDWPGGNFSILTIVLQCLILSSVNYFYKNTEDFFLFRSTDTKHSTKSTAVIYIGGRLIEKFFSLYFDIF